MTLWISPHNDDETLFGAFTLMREKPLVVIVTNSFIQFLRGDRITAEQRIDETKQAMEVLGIGEVRFLALPDNDLHAEDITRELKTFQGYDQVYVPAIQGGNWQHDLIGEVGREVFPRAIRYTTYTKTELWTKGDIEVIPTEEEKELKIKALNCYQSQINLPSTRPHFLSVALKSEWLIN